MAPDPDEPELRPKLGLILLVLVAVYLVSYFPSLSFMVRHPEHQRYSAIYRPIPQPIGGIILRLWMNFDRGGAAIFNRAIEEQRAAGRIP